MPNSINISHISIKKNDVEIYCDVQHLLTAKQNVQKTEQNTFNLLIGMFGSPFANWIIGRPNSVQDPLNG